MRQLAAEGMPRLGRDIYQLRPCVQWYLNYWKERATARTDPTKQEGADLKNQLTRAKLLEATGHLIPRAEVVQVWTAAALRLGTWMDGLSASIGRELNWNSEIIKLVRERMDEGRADFVRDSAEFVEAPPAEAPKPEKQKATKK